MSFITDAVGSGIGIIAIAVGLLILRHESHAPGFAHPWLHRFVIVLMYAGGAALAVTALGHLAVEGIATAAGWFGGLGYGLIHALVVAAILFLLAGVVMGLLFAPDPATAMVAIILPLLLTLPLGGLIHEVGTTFNAPALHLAAALNHFLAG